MEITTSSISERDLSYVWHPFTQMGMEKAPIPIVRAKECYLYAEDGKKYLDGISSWWVNLHGHAHPYISNRIKTQLDQLEHVNFAGFTHKPAVELAERLISILPGRMAKIFYSDNGSTAVETALKMAFQYWYNQDLRTKKIKVICFKNSYHGDTFGAMSVAGKSEFTKPFWKHFFQVEMIDPPIKGHQSLEQLKNILKENSSACFIFEPLILGAGGMITYSPDQLNPLLEMCRKKGVLIIADEVMTGFGRTGPLFACEKINHEPDIICLSKALTGGFLPLGATACQQYIYDAFFSDQLEKAFLHGHTYTANPLACVSALASLDLLLLDSCNKQREILSGYHSNFCGQWKKHPRFVRCETIGTILIVEYQSGSSHSYFNSLRNKLYNFFLDHEILLRPLGNVLYVMPPYCVSEEQMHHIYEKIIESTKL